MRDFTPGDLVRTKLHRCDSERLTCRVVRVRPSGTVEIQGRGGRRMSLLPHQLVMVRASSRSES